MGGWHKLQNKEGLDIFRKVNKIYTAYKISDLTTTLKGKYNHTNQREVEASFSTPLFSKFGTETKLSTEEAVLQHRGSIRSRLKLNINMSEKEVLKQVLIPGAIEYGIEPNYFPLFPSQDPFNRKEGPFLEGIYFHAFTNIFGYTWVAYIDMTDIWVSCNSPLINWNWREYEDTLSRQKALAPWELTEGELEWFDSLVKIRDRRGELLTEYALPEINKK